MNATTPTPPTRFVYLDGETTGLWAGRHDLFEVAWAVDAGPIQEIQFLHTLRDADPEALHLNGYWPRTTGSTALSSARSSASSPGTTARSSSPRSR